MAKVDESQISDVVRDHDRLCAVIGNLDSVVVAFSAGVDSTLVLKVAVDVLGLVKVLAATARSASVPQVELDQAAQLAAHIGVKHVLVDTDEFENPNYTSNPTDRCYFCKRTLYDHLEPLAAARGIQHIANGANTDDLGDWRPGLNAARESNVRSPLLDAELNKAQVRALSLHLGLPTHDKPASPCLSSRIPYGHEVTPQKLKMVESAEAFLKDCLGLRECRVRHYGDEARIEVTDPQVTINGADVLKAIRKQFLSLGFQVVTVDPKGFRSGSLNEVIAFGSRQNDSAPAS